MYKIAIRMAKRGKRIDYILALLSGPGTFRFVIQPAIAILLGLRDGRNDAKSGRPPYFRGQLLDKGKRKESLKGGIHPLKRWRYIPSGYGNRE